jgi:hypothetical protein
MGSIFDAFKALKRVVTGEVIQRIDTAADGGMTTVSLRLKRARGSDELYVVMAVSSTGNYRYIAFAKDELIQFSEAIETIRDSLKVRPATKHIGRRTWRSCGAGRPIR